LGFGVGGGGGCYRIGGPVLERHSVKLKNYENVARWESETESDVDGKKPLP